MTNPPQNPQPQPQPITALQLMTMTQKVGKVGMLTKDKVEEVLDLLTAAPPEGVPDPIEDLKMCLDHISGRLSGLEDLTQKIFDMLTKQQRAR